MPGPAGIVHDRAANRHHIRLAGGDDLLGVLRLVNHAHGHGGDVRLALHLFSEMHHVAGFDRRQPHPWRHIACGGDHIVHADLLQLLGEDHRIVQRQPTFDPILARDAHPNGLASGKGRADGARHFQRKPEATQEIATIFIIAVICEGRAEFMQQIAMGRVDFDHVESAAVSPARRLNEFVAHPLQALCVQLDGRTPLRCEGLWRWALRRPAAFFIGHELPLVKVPSWAGRGLATGMIELDAHGHVGEGAHVSEQLRQRRLVLVRIKPKAARRDATDRTHRRRLENAEACARLGELSDMRPVPWARRAIDGAELAQGRDDDAVLEREVGKLDRREQMRRHFLPQIVLCFRRAAIARVTLARLPMRKAACSCARDRRARCRTGSWAP